MKPPRDALLALARAVFDLVAGQDASSASITLYGRGLTITIAANGLSTLAESPALQAAHLLSPIEQDIVRVIGAGFLIGKAVASRTGYKYDGTLRTILSNLVNRGVLEQTSQGYRVSEPGKEQGP